MVTKSRNAGAKKKGKVKVGKLKLNKETVKDLSAKAQQKVKGGLAPTLTCGGCSITCGTVCVKCKNYLG